MPRPRAFSVRFWSLQRPEPDENSGAGRSSAVGSRAWNQCERGIGLVATAWRLRRRSCNESAALTPPKGCRRPPTCSGGGAASRDRRCPSALLVRSPRSPGSRGDRNRLGRPMSLDPIVMPDATPDWVAHVIERGLAHASECGFEDVDVEIDRADDVLRQVLVGHGFASRRGGTWSRRGWTQTLDQRSARCTRTTGCAVAWTRCCARIT